MIKAYCVMKILNNTLYDIKELTNPHKRKDFQV